MPRTLLCTVRRGERAHGERPRGAKHRKGMRPEKGAREGTGAQEEIAAQRVAYRAHHASELSRRVVGETCRRVALVCPGHVQWGQKAGQATVYTAQATACDRMYPRTGECRASCSEGGGAQREGVGQSTRRKERTGRAKEGREAEGTRQGHRRGQKATDRVAGELRGLPCTVRATARGAGARGREGALHINCCVTCA